MNALALRSVGRKVLFPKRVAHKNLVRKAHDEFMGGSPGENIPFAFHNKNTFSLKFFLFCLSGFWAPFAVVPYQLLKDRLM